MFNGSSQMAHNLDRFTRSGPDPERLAVEAARLGSSMAEVAAYLDLYGAETVPVQTPGGVTRMPAYEVRLRQDRRRERLALITQ